MEDLIMTQESIQEYAVYMHRKEKAESTVEKYVQSLGQFTQWCKGSPITKDIALKWKDHLMKESGYSPMTINGKIAALNSYFIYFGREDIKLAACNVQNRPFRDSSRDLTIDEFHTLVDTAYKMNKANIGLLMETIAATGIRVSEVKYITVESIDQKEIEIKNKGKIRIICTNRTIRRKLRQYAKKNKIRSGPIFLNKNGEAMDRHQIWAAMKSVCEKAGVDPSKVFPHNLRHLFAKTFYRATKDIVQLADILGHSSIQITRRYLLSTCEEVEEVMDSLGIVS